MAFLDENGLAELWKMIQYRLKLVSDSVSEMTVTVKTTSGAPIPGVAVTGVFDASGAEVITDSTGIASGYISSGSSTIGVSGYADLADVSDTSTYDKGSTYSKTLTTTTRNFLKVTSSKKVKFSGNVSAIDVSVVGGGAGGERAVGQDNSVASGAGGSGGYVVTTDGINVTANELYSIAIGAGGKGGGKTSAASASTGGGTSSAFGITANGGGACTLGELLGTYTVLSKSGAGNGSGGNGVDGRSQGRKNGNAGGNGKVAAYISFTETATYGAGGGSGSTGGMTGGGGGSVGGGKGGDYGSDGSNATANTGSGGGGGGGYAEFTEDWNTYVGAGGNGAAGMVGIRIHLKSA